MKFKGQGKINICGFEYKKNIADSRRGGFRAPKKTPVSAPAPPGMYTTVWSVKVGKCVRMGVLNWCGKTGMLITGMNW